MWCGNKFMRHRDKGKAHVRKGKGQRSCTRENGLVSLKEASNIIKETRHLTVLRLKTELKGSDKKEWWMFRNYCVWIRAARLIYIDLDTATKNCLPFSFCSVRQKWQQVERRGCAFICPISITSSCTVTHTNALSWAFLRGTRAIQSVTHESVWGDSF